MIHAYNKPPHLDSNHAGPGPKHVQLACRSFVPGNRIFFVHGEQTLSRDVFFPGQLQGTGQRCMGPENRVLARLALSILQLWLHRPLCIIRRERENATKLNKCDNTVRITPPSTADS